MAKIFCLQRSYWVSNVCAATNVRKLNGHAFRKSISPDFVSGLSAIVGDKNVFTSDSALKQYEKDASDHAAQRPDVAVRPSNAEQVSHVAKLCYRDNVPIVPFGIGSGLEGGIIPVRESFFFAKELFPYLTMAFQLTNGHKEHPITYIPANFSCLLGIIVPRGGVTIDLSQMNKVLVVHPEDFDVYVESGITRNTLNSHLRDTGLWFPVDPGADATIGGMASTSASGTNAVRYGTMRENVLNLEVVLADGTVIHTAGRGMRAKKTSAGYNLTNLFVGSEGTLGIITKVSLRLFGMPEMITSAICSFPSVSDAVTSAIQTLQSNVPIARVELLDALSMKACNSYSNLRYKELPTLFLEFHGTDSSVSEQARIVASIAASNKGEDFVWTKDAEERRKLWKARNDLYYAVRALQPGWESYTTDVCVPISELPRIVVKMQNKFESQGIIGSVLGHVGDGNFHSILLYESNNLEDRQKITKIVDDLAKEAWASNGTCTGEHGVGLGKMHMLEEEIGASGLNIMRNIKRTLDPLNIMNPGKVIHI